MKRIIKFLKRLFGNFWIQLVVLLAFAAGIFALGGAFASQEGPWVRIFEMVTGSDVLSIFIAAAVSIIVAKVLFKVDAILEESLKLEDDHHKIVTKYDGHSREEIAAGEDIVAPEGRYLYLRRAPDRRRRPGNMVPDRYAKDYEFREREIADYMENGKVLLSSICLYANVKGNAVVCFDDSNEMQELPIFLRENAANLLKAHGTSTIHNNVTIRLNDVAFDGNRLTLCTGRSQYFYMLITNRCMDYKIGEGLTVREVYECSDRVSLLSQSKLGNQIGINGLIITRDGYLLLEKRGSKKATWKNKFAQPISLAMKESALGLDGGVLSPDENAADEVFGKIIRGTICNNYGITQEDIVPFSMRRNFFGVARDLLEGGKPNLYFYVVVDMTAQQLKEHMEQRAETASLFPTLSPEERAARAGEKNGLPRLTKDKLESEFYLVPHEAIAVDFGYRMHLKARDMIRVKRKFAPRVNPIRAGLDGLGHRLRRLFHANVCRGCGEALLVCLAYADLCLARMKAAAHRKEEHS